MANEYNVRNDLFIKGTLATGGETSPDASTGGITLLTDGANGITLKRAGETHSMAWVDADTYGVFGVSDFGIDISGYGDSTSPFSLSAITTLEDTNDASVGTIALYPTKYPSGTFSATANVFSVYHGSTLLNLKASGDLLLAAGTKIGDSARTDNGTIKYASNQFQFRQNGSWTTLTAGSVAGSDTQVQFNNSGSFGASANFTWNGTILGVNGTISTGGETSPDVNAGGITLHQGSGVGSILSIKNTVVSHPFTTHREADTYAVFSLTNATDGGLTITGIKDNAGGGSLLLQGWEPTPDTSDTGWGVVDITAYKTDGGTSIAAIATTDNLLSLHAGGSTKAVIKGSGNYVSQGDSLVLATSKTPATAGDTGQTGQICWDSGYIYVCTAANTWKRAAITTW